MPSTLPDFLYYEPIRYRSFRVRFSPPTNTRGARTIIYDTWHKQYVSLPHDDNYGQIVDRALAYLKEQGFDIKGMSCTNRDWYDLLLTTDFTKKLRPSKKDKST